MPYRIILSALLTISTVANGDWAASEPPNGIIMAQKITMGQAAKKLQSQINGRVLGAKSVQQGGKQYYVFKVLTEKDGRVRQIKVDPATGQITGR